MSKYFRIGSSQQSVASQQNIAGQTPMNFTDKLLGGSTPSTFTGVKTAHWKIDESKQAKSYRDLKTPDAVKVQPPALQKYKDYCLTVLLESTWNNEYAKNEQQLINKKMSRNIVAASQSKTLNHKFTNRNDIQNLPKIPSNPKAKQLKTPTQSNNQAQKLSKISKISINKQDKLMKTGQSFMKIAGIGSNLDKYNIQSNIESLTTEQSETQQQTSASIDNKHIYFSDAIKKGDKNKKQPKNGGQDNYAGSGAPEGDGATWKRSLVD